MLNSSPATFSRRLNAPPRPLDGAQRLAVMTKGTEMLFAAAVITGVLVALGPTLRRDGVVAQLLPHDEAEAVVDTVEQVMRRGKNRSWPEWEVTARIVGQPDVVASGSLRSPVAVGDRVHALVPTARPDLALAWRDDRQPSLLAFWAAVASLVFGVAVTAAGLVRNRRDLGLLRDGLLTRGTIVERTSRPVKGTTEWTLTFRYVTARDGAQTTRVVVRERDLGRLVDEESELLVYDAARPERALLLDALPDHVRVAEDGSLTPIPWRRGLLRSIPLVAAVVLFGVFLAILLG